MSYELEIPGTPPSFNAIASRRWQTITEKKSWEGHCFIALLHQKVPKALPIPVHATAVLRFKDRRRRDEGNFRWLLEKALGDALQKGGWIGDDTPEHFTFGALTFDPEVGKPLTTITLEVSA